MQGALVFQRELLAKKGKEMEPKKAGWETQGDLFRLSLVRKVFWEQLLHSIQDDD
jgi:hypothetical protein